MPHLSAGDKGCLWTYKCSRLASQETVQKERRTCRAARTLSLMRARMHALCARVGDSRAEPRAGGGADECRGAAEPGRQLHQRAGPGARSGLPVGLAGPAAALPAGASAWRLPCMHAPPFCMRLDLSQGVGEQLVIAGKSPSMWRSNARGASAVG
jgi:hypothetical protein